VTVIIEPSSGGAVGDFILIQESWVGRSENIAPDSTDQVTNIGGKTGSNVLPPWRADDPALERTHAIDVTFRDEASGDWRCNLRGGGL
jgi:hypothetical protein